MAPSQNIVGPMVKRIRQRRGWTQSILTAKCAISGWDINEHTIAKIEAGIRCVKDWELLRLAKALDIKVHDLIPGDNRIRPPK
jgi:DNA-binding XRE family transcriptional regulator